MKPSAPSTTRGTTTLERRRTRDKALSMLREGRYIEEIMAATGYTKWGVWNMARRNRLSGHRTPAPASQVFSGRMHYESRKSGTGSFCAIPAAALRALGWEYSTPIEFQVCRGYLFAHQVKTAGEVQP